MYRYDSFDREFVRSRVAQFRQQVERRIDGSLTEEEFKPLRLMNGLYLQLHAYMLRVAIPYGTLDSRQMRQLAHIAERWDKGYGHFTTRQNVQFNWPRWLFRADWQTHDYQERLGRQLRNSSAPLEGDTDGDDSLAIMPTSAGSPSQLA